MKNNKEKKLKESIIAKYLRVRKALKQICEDYMFSSDEYLSKYQEENLSELKETELYEKIAEMNGIIRGMIKKFCVEEWGKTIIENFDESQYMGTAELIVATIQCDASNAYMRFSKVMTLLDLLNDEQTKSEALKLLEEYCSTHSFEDLVNEYDLVFRSKHSKEVSEARNRGFESQKLFGRKKKKAYQSYFSASEKKKTGDDDIPKQPVII